MVQLQPHSLLSGPLHSGPRLYPALLHQEVPGQIGAAVPRHSQELWALVLPFGATKPTRGTKANLCQKIKVQMPIVPPEQRAELLFSVLPVTMWVSASRVNFWGDTQVWGAAPKQSPGHKQHTAQPAQLVSPSQTPPLPTGFLQEQLSNTERKS